MKTTQDMINQLSTPSAAGEYVQHVSGNGSGSYNGHEIPADHAVWDLWDALRGAWPGFTAKWQDEPPAAWVYAVDDLNPGQVAGGVRRMVREGGEFPPSAPKFRELALGATDAVAAQQQRQAEQDPAKLLPNGRKGKTLDPAEGWAIVRKIAASYPERRP